MCFGQLNYIKITNNTKMEGKLKKRYSRILQELELNHGEIIKDSVMVKDGKKIVNIRTYSSSSDSPGFSLTQNDVNNRATVAIVFDDDDIKECYFIDKGEELYIISEKVSELKLSPYKTDIECIKEKIKKLISGEKR